ncbi:MULTISPECIES: flagellar hook capping FlgD N-terminal domain-containing protein [unclassified Hahella]|uniref:flagellar hook capping FlgD N-terminal domain-containing protein n=1 Tax=unclassified Hahella TaxID=2624107 RepID=UPI001C1F1D52|nr:MULTISPECIES: flagellar hook capping FlgD N-terminal domain-containing protein [unclassified Hahella]MBU6955223.1 flagellar hook capping protein [Hahella sp. HN01]WLQ15710.1 flagellar hook capping FlgD N-terminal domain-containing protein [Hahella sp. HNIBRBA332]
MAIDSIARVSAEAGGLKQNTVGIEDFLQIFLTQLTFQDPLEPVDNREFIAQLAQFSSLETATRTNENIEGLLDVQSVAQTVGLIGKTVQVNDEQGFAVGKVSTITFNNGKPEITMVQEDGTPIVGISPSRISLVRE